MKVLLPAEGLLNETGGGQSLYRDWVAESPEIEFFALVPEDAIGDVDVSGLTNVRWIPLGRTHRDRIRSGLLDGLDGPWGSLAGKEDVVGLLLDIGAAVAGMSFDVVDVPDYLPFGGLLPAALASFGVEVGRRVISLHGSLAQAIEGGWVQGATAPEIKQLEIWAYLAADTRYGPSDDYLGGWQDRTKHEAFVLSLPRRRLTLRASASTMAAEVSGPDPRPELCFVGRQEKWKGPDLFVEYCSRLPQELFKAFRIVGPAVDAGGRSSEEVLRDMAGWRQLDISFESVPPDQIDSWLAGGRRIIMLPSREDPFNLVALEALMQGCPVIVSKKCGVTSFIRDQLPGVPFVEFDPDDIMSTFKDVVDLATSFDHHRAALVAALGAIGVDKATPSRLVNAYERPTDFQREARRTLDLLWRDILARLHTWVDEDSDEVGKLGRNTFVDVMYRDSVGTLSCDFVREQIMDTFRLRESTGWYRSNAELSDQIMATVAPRLANGLNRAALYRWLGHSAGEAGDALHYATYTMRAMRLSGRYAVREANLVGQALLDVGMPEEAVVVDLLAHGSDVELFDYLSERRRRFYHGPKSRYRTAVDRRTGLRPRVTVIVSLYNARRQLEVFLRELARLSTRSKQLVEVVFVDSGSQDNTRALLMRLLEEQCPDLQTLVVYTKDRETIQRAWNRGILLARGDFLSFLGTDETVRPDAFEVMVDHMDANPACDWVQGDAIVTNVNDAGSYIEDVFVYHRVLENRFAYLLDTCLVGHVGAMYRKSVHDRCGFYDDSFKGAGDTEFKNRALPQLRVDTIPAVLGTYLNYAAERTTNSARIELEDIRAWYAFRTPAGVSYLQDASDGGSIAHLFRMCFNYQKSYSNLWSTDIELAHAIAQCADRVPLSAGIDLGMDSAAVWHLRQAARRIDDAVDIRPFRGLADAKAILRSFEDAWRHLKLGRSLASHSDNLYLLNDNRWQQHNWIWPDTLPRAQRVRGDRTVVAQEAISVPVAPEVARVVEEATAVHLDLGPQNFDDDYYLALYPDVATAVAGGIFAGGWEHYRDFGAAEGRKARGGSRRVQNTPRSVRRVKGISSRKGNRWA